MATHEAHFLAGEELRDTLAVAGVQRIVTLGGAAANGDDRTIPGDGIEVLRRRCHWIVDERDPVRRAIAIDGLPRRAGSQMLR